MSAEDFRDDPDAGVEPLDGEDEDAGVEPLDLEENEALEDDWEEDEVYEEE